MFDSKAFLKTQFEQRKKDIRVDVLQGFFGEEDPVWTVRAMTHSEYSKIMTASTTDIDVKSVVSALAGDNKEKQEIFKKLLGVDDDTMSKETRFKVEMLKTCSVSPKCDQQLAVKIAKFFPGVLESLTQIIVEMTDQGGIEAKKKQKSCIEAES